ncbi:MAG: DUF2330 domain-containing protein, partial [Bacteroidota bacterium]
DVQRMLNPNELSPIQITYEHDNFMLPIRLGMANSKGEQALVVYGFTPEGRIECTNYRTVEMPTGNDIPPFVEPNFGGFYKKVFDKEYQDNGRNAVFLEYAWNVTPQNRVKCDPCIGPPPIFVDFQKAGVDWVAGNNSSSYVHFTRLHVRYSRDKFPQDLSFQVTPNRKNYQARYVMTHPATGEMSCDEGQKYILDLGVRQRLEKKELAHLTGWDMKKHPRFADFIRDTEHAKRMDTSPYNSGSLWSIPLIAFMIAIGARTLLKMRRKETSS